MKLVDAEVGPHSALTRRHVLRLPLVWRQPEHIEVEGGDQIVTAALVVDVEVVDDEHVARGQRTQSERGGGRDQQRNLHRRADANAWITDAQIARLV